MSNQNYMNIYIQAMKTFSSLCILDVFALSFAEIDCQRLLNGKSFMGIFKSV